jgi:hypothetical protein
VLPAAVLLIGSVQPADAYIDPNAAGPLYQLLFPLLIAIGSAVAFMRRYIRELWNRVVQACLAAFRHKSASDGGSEHLP